MALQPDLKNYATPEQRAQLDMLKDKGIIGENELMQLGMERKPGLRNGAPLKKESPSRINRIRQTIFSSRKIMALP